MMTASSSGAGENPRRPSKDPGAGTRGWAWVATAAALGLAASWGFAGRLGLGRSAFVAAFAAAVLPFLVVFARANGVHPAAQVRRRWQAGLLGGLLLGALLARTVASQPSSARSTGWPLSADLAWLGVLYGSIDALLLSILPVLAVYGSRGSAGLASARGRMRAGLEALAASLLVTSAYHLGFAEFRGPGLARALLGNGVLTAAYLVTGNPLTPLVGHVLMHVAAVLHGPASTAQLPPH